MILIVGRLLLEGNLMGWIFVSSLVVLLVGLGGTAYWYLKKKPEGKMNWLKPYVMLGCFGLLGIIISLITKA